MTRASMWIHVGLCVVALGFAWRGAHAVRERTGPSSTLLLAADEGEVVDVAYVWDKGTTHVRRDGGAVVVELDRELPAKPEKKDDKKNEKKDETTGAKDGSGDVASGSTDATTAPPAREQLRFPGGRPVHNAIKALEPLRSKRTLGVVDETRLAAMGLSRPTRSLTMTTKQGRAVTLELGDASFGSQGRYARIKGDDVVHLIDAVVVSGVEGGADTLLEKQPLTAELDEIRGYAVKAGDRTASFVHVAREQPAKRFVARRDDGETKDDAATKLLGTLRNLRGTRLADAPTAAAAGAVVAAFAVDTGAPLTVEIVERGDGTGHLVRVKPWTWELATTPTRELLDDVDAVFAP
jgi:hypothetical protein